MADKNNYLVSHFSFCSAFCSSGVFGILPFVRLL